MQRATFCSSAPFNHEPRLKLHSCPNKDSCNGAHFSAKKLNAPIVILLLCKIAPRRRIICKHSADPWPFGRQRERERVEEKRALFGKRCTCLLTRVHIIPSAHSAQFTRGLPVLLYFYKPRRLRRRDESISSGCVYIRLHAAQFALCVDKSPAVNGNITKSSRVCKQASGEQSSESEKFSSSRHKLNG